MTRTTASIVDPGGVGPAISFLRVPDGKTTKNRVHIVLLDPEGNEFCVA
jgi:hypothetical protein